MKINPTILKYLDEVNVSHKEGVPYLLCIKYGYYPNYIPKELRTKVNATGIVFKEGKEWKWNVELFEGQEDGYKWVETEFIQLFADKNPKKAGKKNEATKRMKQVFFENPDLRKSDVIGATKMYLMNTETEYIRFPHYFIYKGVGVNKVYDLLDWVDKYRTSVSAGVGRTSLSNTMK